MCSRRAAAATAAMLLTAVAARAGTVSVAGPSSASPGGTVTVTVTLSADLSAVYALQGALAYDPAVLTPLPSQEATAPRSFYPGSQAPFPGETIPKDADLFRMNASQAGTLIFGYVKNPSNPPGSSSVAVPPTALGMTFNVAPGASGATTVRLAPYEVNGQSMPAVLTGAVDGSVIGSDAGLPLRISIGTAGDVNGDGGVNALDVLLALQLAGGLAPSSAYLTGVANGDVWPPPSGDGDVTLQDAVRLLRFIGGLETSLD